MTDVLPAAGVSPLPLVRWAALGYTPNGWALDHLHGRREQFRAICTTRQCGKTTGAAAEVDEGLRRPTENGTPPWVGVLSFDLKHARMLVDRWFGWVRRTDGADRYYQNINDHVIIDRRTGAKLEWISADDPYAIAGPTFTKLIIDEAQKIPDDVWAKGLPTILRHESDVICTGTPDVIPDQSWFYGMWLRGQDESESDYHSATVSCFENKWISPRGIRLAREQLSDDEFRMLLLGQWVALGGEVFPSFRHCFDVDGWAEPAEGKPYVMGLDVAKERDYTVAYVADAESKTVVQRLRVNKLDYPDVEQAVYDLYRRYHCRVLHADDTGVGKPLTDYLRRRGVVVRGFTFSSKTKTQLVQNLNRMLQHGELHLPRADGQLLRELGAYRRKVTAAGNVQYAAPANYFDDCVMALGLVALTLRHGAYGGSGTVSESYVTW